MNDRLRVQIDETYVVALGRAAYVFATLEWNAVWCCERMRKGYIHNLGRKTVGAIARDLLKLARKRPLDIRDACIPPAEVFCSLVDVRNAIFHGKPGTAAGGAQRLFREGQVWESRRIDEAADNFARCSIRLNALLYDELSES